MADSQTCHWILCLLASVLWITVHRSWAQPQQNMHNVSKDKTCTLSSVYYWTHRNGEHDDDALYATYHENNTCHAVINGNTSTRYGKGNCIFTHWDDRNPHWTLDLGQPYVISKITVYARNTTNKYTFNSDYLKRMRGVMVAIDGSVVHTFDSDVKNIQPETDIFLSPPRSGKEINITRQKQSGESYNLLSFCEVQIWVCNDGYYGTNCTNRCGHCKNKDTCDKSSGECPHGCQPGWFPQQLCDRPCGTGYYGDLCNDKCGTGCATQQCHTYDGCRECDQTTGDCHCRDGWGPVGKCNVPQDNDNTGKDSSKTTLIGTIAGVGVFIVAIIIIAFVIFWLRKSRAARPQRNNSTPKESRPGFTETRIDEPPRALPPRPSAPMESTHVAEPGTETLSDHYDRLDNYEIREDDIRPYEDLTHPSKDYYNTKPMGTKEGK